MFTKIQHVGYQVRDLDATVAWFERVFEGKKVGGGPSRSGGRNAFIHYGQIEVELIEPANRDALPADTLVMHHVGYVVPDIFHSVEQLKPRGFKFVADKPNTNVIGQQVLYFDASTTNRVQLHLTQLPAQPDATGYGQGLPVERILHAGYLVDNLEQGIAWYENHFDGRLLGTGPSRRGNRNCFVDFGAAQVELIETFDQNLLCGNTCVMDHVGYVVSDIRAVMAEWRSRGMTFETDEPRINGVGQQLAYFTPEQVMGARIHLTQLPD